MEQLHGVIRDYRWGSPTAIPELLGIPATGGPVAELWLGAHPSAPALVGHHRERLDELVAADPLGALGVVAAQRFESLPFLLKVLAADSPLSLQAHPSSAQAEAGYERETEAGIPLEAPNRSFRDRRHKPELICALTEFSALCGFRNPEATIELLATIDTAALDPIREPLAASPDGEGLRQVLQALLAIGAGEAAELVPDVVAACAAGDSESGRRERAMAVTLGAVHGDDVGVVIALLLNLVTLQPGQAMFLPSGVLHSYLGGTGVEIMANSDNVLRGGLTSKHVDVGTLLEVVDTEPSLPVVQHPRLVEGVARYHCPVAEFSLARLEVDGSLVLDPGPAILLCIEGSVRAGPCTIDAGAAAWLAADEGPVELIGVGTLFRAAMGVP